jgi:hypothetical protein
LPGFQIGVDESTDKVAKVWSQRQGGPKVETTFTITEAAQAGLTDKDTWRKSTRQMLLHRAMTDNLRITAADALIGATYSVEELQDAGFESSKKPAPIIDATYTVDESGLIDATNFEEVKE